MASTRPAAEDVSLDELDVRQFVLDATAQRLLCIMQHALVDAPYNAFGHAEGSTDLYNIVMPKTFGSDRRKPLSDAFQQFCEDVFWPLANALLFSVAGWERVRRNLTAFKLNTLVIGGEEDYYNKPIYHFHLDHKIGKLNLNDSAQKRTMRMIFSTVPAALDDDDPANAAAYDSTVYLRSQPSTGFPSFKELHAYMATRFPERGLSANKQRPLYEVDDSELYRAPPGEVLIHTSHPGCPIHAECNPCPDGRCLYVLDWQDCPHYLAHAQPADAAADHDDGRRSSSSDAVAGSAAADAPAEPTWKQVVPYVRMPRQEILDLLRVLTDCLGDDRFYPRLSEMVEIAARVMPIADKYPGGREGLERVLKHVHELQRGRMRGRDGGPVSEPQPGPCGASCTSPSIPAAEHDSTIGIEIA